MIIDTCVFRDGAFIEAIKEYHGTKCISSITYTEMQVYLMGKKNKPSNYFDNILRKVNIDISTFTKHEALSAAKIGIVMEEFKKNSRDYMIAAHAIMAPWIVITYNKKDFTYLRERVYDPEEFRRAKNL